MVMVTSTWSSFGGFPLCSGELVTSQTILSRNDEKAFDFADTECTTSTFNHSFGNVGVLVYCLCFLVCFVVSGGGPC
jgi:hypothetical protein